MTERELVFRLDLKDINCFNYWAVKIGGGYSADPADRDSNRSNRYGIGLS